MILAKLFALIFFVFHTFLASNSLRTDFIRLDKSGQYPLITFANSTSKVHRIGLHDDSDAFLFSIAADSSFVLDSSTIVSSGSFIPFSLSGQLYLTSLNFATSNEHDVIGSLALTPSFSKGIELTASVHLSSSSLRNLAMTNNFGTFLSSGLSASQTLQSTTFENITIYDSTETGAVTLTDKCMLDDCVFTNCQDTFYGLIVSGLTCKTKSWFSAVNSTFTGCMRQEPLAIPVLRRVLDNDNCGSVVADKSTTTSQTYGCRQEIENTFWGDGSYTFVSCTFDQCQAPSGQSGGALYQTKGSIYNSEKLNLTSCTFTKCFAPEHGGAVYSDYTNHHIIYDCEFTGNSITHTDFLEGTVVNHDAGAVLCNFTGTTLSVKKSKFTSNIASGRGGGLYLGNIQSGQTGHLVEDCQFMTNTAQYFFKDAAGNRLNIAAGIGAGLYSLPIQAVTFGECAFINNKAGWHGAGFVFAFRNVPSQNVFNWFMFSGNKAYEGADIYIRAPTMRRTAVDQWTFTDSLTVPPQANRYQYNTSANEKTIGTNDNWLVVGPEVFVSNQVSESNMNTTSCRHYYTNTHCQTISSAVLDGRGLTTLFTVRTIRVSLVNSATAYTDNKAVNVGESIIHVGPINSTSTASLSIESASISPAVFDISTGIANLTRFTITVDVLLSSHPLAKITSTEAGAGQLWLYSMTIKSQSGKSHSTSLFQLNTGYLYVSGTTIQDFTFTNCPLISFDTTTTRPPRFYDSKIKNVMRTTGGGSVLSLTFDKNSKNIQVYGLSCEECSAPAGNGGAVAATISKDSGKTLTFTSCSFTDCNSQTVTGSVKNGGAVYINIDDTTSTVRMINSQFTFEGDKVRGQYLHIDCLDGEYVGATDNWSGTLDVTGTTKDDRPYYWVDEKSGLSRSRFSKSLYYFVFAPSDVPKDKRSQNEMIVDKHNGGDIRTCGWSTSSEISEDGIPCCTIKKAFDQRSDIQTISLTPSQNPSSPNEYTVGTDQFVVVSDLTITGTDKTKSTIAIDTWSSVSPVFQIQMGTTTIEHVTIVLQKNISAQFMYISSSSDDYNGAIELKTVSITSKVSGIDYRTSNYFLRTTKGAITLDTVAVENFQLSNNPFVGVSTSSHKSTLTIKSSTFTNVVSEKGKGSVISLSTSCYCDITLNTVTFTDCISSTAYGAIYDYQALTDGTSSVFDKSSTFSFTSVTFTSAKQYVYFDEPGKYFFKTEIVTKWQALVGYDSSKAEKDGYDDFSSVENHYMALASGSSTGTTVIQEPSQPFSLVHICFTPKDAHQTQLYVAGTVGEEVQYFDVTNYEYQGCGWEDIPCKTIAQALVQAPTTGSYTITLKSGAHQAETSSVSLSSEGGVTVKGPSAASTIKAVQAIGTDPIFSIASPVAFKNLTFIIDADLTVFSLTESNPVGSHTLELDTFTFQVELEGDLQNHLIKVSGITDNRLTIKNTVFSSSSKKAGSYIYVENAVGTVFKPENEADTKLTEQFTVSMCLSADRDLYIVNETGVTLTALRTTQQTASLLHFIYAPSIAGTGATEIYLDQTSGDDAITTCGWSDVPCSSLAKAINQRGSLTTILVRGDYSITEAVSHNTGSIQIVIKSEPDDDAESTFSLGTLQSSTADVFTVTSTYSLTFTSVKFDLKNTANNNPTGSFFYSSGSLTFDSVELASSANEALTYKVISLGASGSLSITGSTFGPSTGELKLTHSLIGITGTKASVSLLSGSTFSNIVNEGNKPALLNCPAIDNADPQITLLIDSSNFNNLVSQNCPTGGAIYVAQGPRSSVQLLSSTLYQCKCKADGRGDFIYIDCDNNWFTGDFVNKKLNLLVSSVTCTHRTDIDIRNGLQLFINCGSAASSLTTRVDSSMFLVQLTSTIKSTAYSFWGKSDSTGGEVDLLLHFKFYTANSIYVDHEATESPGTGEWEGIDYASRCGNSDTPCKYLDIGAKHVITLSNDDSYLYLKQATGDALPSQTSLRDLTLRPESSTETVTSELKASTGVSISVSGTVTIERILFKALDTINKELISTKAFTTLTITKCGFEGTSIPKSVVSLTNSRLILQNEELSSLPIAEPFIVASGVSGTEFETEDPENRVYTIHLKDNKFTDLTFSEGFLSTTNGATVYCKNTEFSFTEVTTVSTLFVLTGNTLIEGLRVGHTGATKEHTLSKDLIKLSGSATLLMKSVRETEPAQISDLSTSNNHLISSTSTGPITLDGCIFSSIKHDSSEQALFVSSTADILKGCIFREISQTSTGPLLQPTSPLTSITNCHFYFTDDSAKNIITFVGGSTLTECTFQHTTANTKLPITGTLITIVPSAINTNPVTFVQCEFINIGTVSASIISCSKVDPYVINIVLNNTKFTYSPDDSTLSTFVHGDGDVELVNKCSITAYTPLASRANDKTLTNEELFQVGGSLTLTDMTISGLSLGKAIISLTGNSQTLTVTSCTFTDLTLSGEVPALLTYASAPNCIFTGTSDDRTTFSTTDYLLTAPSGTTFTYCTFTAPSPSQINGELLKTAEASTVTFTNCDFSNLYSASDKAFISGTTGTIIVNSVHFNSGDKDTGNFISLYVTGGAVQISDSTFEGTGKLLSNLISAETVDVERTDFKTFDHSHTPSQAPSLFTSTFTVAGCTFASISQTSSNALLSPTTGTITVSDTFFTFTSGNMKNLMKIYGGSDIRNCSFAATTDVSIPISDTLITVAGGSIPVTFELCNFTKISSTPEKAVIASQVGVIFDRIIFSYKGDSPSAASLNAFATTTSSLEFKDCFFGPYTKVPLEEAEPSQPRHQGNDEPSATLNSAFITLGKDATLTLTNTQIVDLTITGTMSCLITTDLTLAELEQASSISIDSCKFENVVQTSESTKVPTVPIINTPKLTTFTISNCEFDALTQAKDSYLLDAPTATSFTITNTTFSLPETVYGSILHVTQTVTFTGCSFIRYKDVGAAVTTVYAPLIHVEDRTDLSLINCTFSQIHAGTTTDGTTTKTVPAVVDLGESITLTARNCIFTTISSDIKIGQVFNAKASATFDKCEFTETVVQEVSTEVCYWNASIVQLSGGDFTLTNTKFHSISEGALGISGGAHVRINGWDFSGNHPKEGKRYVQAMQRNINCTEASSLTIKDTKIQSTTSLYLITDTCDIAYDMDEANKPLSTFFIPTLSAAEGNCPDYTTLSLKFTGTDLLPCNLNFEIFLDGEDTPSFTGPMSDNKGAALVRSNDGAATGPTEVTFETDVDLSNTPEVYSRVATGVRLSYGEGEERKTAKTTFDPAIRFPSQREAQGGTVEPEAEEDKWNWWYYVLIGAGALLLLLIILLIICCFCCRDEEKEEDEDEEEEEDIKTVNTEALLSLNTKDLLPSTAFKDFDANKVVTVEAMNTAAPFDKTVISAKKSIYYQIHNPSSRQEHNPFMWTATIAFHVSTGVQHILDTLYSDQPTGSNEVTTDVMKNILNTLCPHCIFTGERDSIVLGSVPNSYQVPVSANAKEGKTDFVFECQRYRSPEMTAHPNDDTRAMKESNAVFAIGLIMYEIFTGWLVFDGYPHSRVVEMVSQGARPDLVLVRSVDANFASIIEAATAMDAEQRPTIAQLLEKIDMYLPNDLRKGATQHRITASMIDDDDL